MINKVSEVPEVALFRAVIAQAIADATIEIPVNGSSYHWVVVERHRIYARRWLTRNSEDFRLVCEYGALEPDAVLEACIKLRQQDWPSPARQNRAPCRHNMKEAHAA